MTASDAAALSIGPGPAVIGVDVGGTSIKATLADRQGRLRTAVRRPTPIDPDRPGERVLAEVVELVEELRAAHPEEPPAAVGLAVPGLVDEVRGIALLSTNLGWRDLALGELAQAELGLPVALSHDVTAAGLAETTFGAAADDDSSVVIVIGTGIAAALTLDGRPYRAGGLAGEIGHLQVAAGPACTCGGSGCLEAVASASAITRRYGATAGTPVEGAQDVIARAAAGDPVAGPIWDEALDALALGISHIAAILAPPVVVLGGGLSTAGSALIDPLNERLDSLIRVTRRPRLELARFVGDSGLVGSLVAARSILPAPTGQVAP